MRRADPLARALDVARANVMRGLELIWIVVAFIGMLVVVALSRLVGVYAYRLRFGRGPDADVFESHSFRS
jgi:hypothetical protein